MKKIIMCLIIILSGIPSASATEITIINQSSHKINEAEMLKLSQKYKTLVLKYWKVPEVPILIYFVDDWKESAKASVGENYIGYHWYSGLYPHIYINMTNVKKSRTPLSFILTHELGETLVNPFVNKYVYYKGNKVYIEICDPTSARFYMNGYPVSDFVFPSFYNLKGKAPYSYLRVSGIKKPFVTTSGFLWTD